MNFKVRERPRRGFTAGVLRKKGAPNGRVVGQLSYIRVGYFFFWGRPYLVVREKDDDRGPLSF